ncbi:Na(+)/H(+) antiporter NhaD [Cucumis melo var. makuwa]|uniref:Na(+)/H(+) antiporter NhaD n=1 Tax=Cucumis melo var. makuwa TaxID=1194695 RepID=A0A5A7T6S2_CUCMM|nr:Na(+)/H(+) antiporter NhaD [Cucumis melo var. makuwa]TYK13898.1 Na(+)/H(+) antiporter NhaD [Cucumis melo var. makuwa]
MQALYDEHREAVNRIMKYLKTTPSKGLMFRKSNKKTIGAYTDSDWAGSIVDRKFTSGYCTFVWRNLITWKSKKQSVVARSSVKEYETPRKYFCDNKAAIIIANNLVQHDRTKHVGIIGISSKKYLTMRAYAFRTSLRAKRLLGAVIVIAANAGGAWTPIGDVTTTMLWIHGQITTMPTLKDLVIPSAVSLAVPLALLSLTSEVNGKGQDFSDVMASEQMAPRGKLVFSVGVGALVFVPVFKALTGLPPYMGMLLGLGILWILTDAIHYGESERQRLKVPQALSRIDTQGALFFLGILLSVSSLEAAGVLRELANYLDAHIPNVELIASAVGVISAIIDNVPLVAATMGMYDLSSFAQDSEFWQLIAFCAGTGGSMLIIGSAAGVAFMGMEKVDFFWYLRKVSGFAFAGYAAGIAAYLALHNFNISLPTTIAEVPSILGS